jgi:hypothetical protein
METELSALEISGVINQNHQIELDEPLPIDSDTRVRVIVLYLNDDGFTEKEWLQNASKNEVFDFLKNDSEDIYTLEDGKPITDEI